MCYVSTPKPTPEPMVFRLCAGAGREGGNEHDLARSTRLPCALTLAFAPTLGLVLGRSGEHGLGLAGRELVERVRVRVFRVGVVVVVRRGGI
jgi:hypothetical protein